MHFSVVGEVRQCPRRGLFALRNRPERHVVRAHLSPFGFSAIRVLMESQVLARKVFVPFALARPVGKRFAQAVLQIGPKIGFFHLRQILRSAA